MRTTILASAAAIALVLTIGSVSAADQSTTPKQFNTLNGVKAVPMSSGELSAVKGMDHHFFVNGVRRDTDQHQNDIEGNPATGAGNFVPILKADGTTQLAAPGYRGLILHACGNGVISGPSIAWCVP